MNNIILTGATGIIGSHLLYDLIDQRLSGKEGGKLVLLVRPSKLATAQERIRHVLTHKYIPSYLQNYTSEELLSKVEIVSCSFMDEDLEGKLTPYQKLADWHVIHSAASTNLATTETAKVENHEVNL